MSAMIIKGNSTAVGPEVPLTLTSSQIRPPSALTSGGKNPQDRHHGRHNRMHQEGSSLSSSMTGAFDCRKLAKKRRHHTGSGDDLSPDIRNTRHNHSHMNNSCVCCIRADHTEIHIDSVCVAIGQFCTDSILPLFGVTRFRTKKYKWDDPYSQDLLRSVQQNFHRLYGFLHQRLLPPFRPLVLELCFRTGQVEADGLSVVSAQIWAATYILKDQLSSLNRSDRDKIRDLFLELAWEAEKSFMMDKEFYAIHQRFKKRVLPRIWKLEENYSGERREFIDPQLRDDLRVERPFDDLYLREEFKFEERKLRLHIYIKNQNKNQGEILSGPLGEREKVFDEASTSRRFKVMWSLLHFALKSLIRLGKGLQKNIKILQDENVGSETGYPIKCRHSLDMMENLLRVLSQEVILPTGKESELVDWVCCVIDDCNNYLTCSQWVCDRIAEARGMVQICYENLVFFHGLELPAYTVLQEQIKDVYRRYKLGLDVSHMFYCGEDIGRKFFVVNNKDSNHSNNNVMSKGGSKKNSVVSRHFEHGSIYDNMTVPAAVQRKMKNGNDFLCTEYPRLLTRLPLFVDDMRLLFRIEDSV